MYGLNIWDNMTKLSEFPKGFNVAETAARIADNPIVKRPRMSSHLSMEAILLSRSANDFE